MSKIVNIKKPDVNKMNYGEIYTRKEELKLINKLYIGENKTLESLLKTKLSGYRQQDFKKKLDLTDIISLENVIEKLIISKLQCYYCKCHVCITTKIKRDKKQWTLDRIDNDKGHNVDNVVIACLECNLKRRCQSQKKFLFTKQLNIHKIN